MRPTWKSLMSSWTGTSPSARTSTSSRRWAGQKWLKTTTTSSPGRSRSCTRRIHRVLDRRQHNPLPGAASAQKTKRQKIQKYLWSLQGEESEISAGKIRVEFIKSYRDNPKINAIVLIKVRKQKSTIQFFKLSTIQFSNCPLLSFQIVHFSIFKLSTIQLLNCPPFNFHIVYHSIVKLSTIQGTLEDFPKLAPLPVEPEEDEVADDLKVYIWQKIWFWLLEFWSNYN